MQLQTIERADRLNLRRGILNFESQLRNAENAFIGNNEQCPLKHTFSDGIYVREMFLPKGMTIVGKIHKHEHPYFILKGEVTIINEHEGKKRIKGPCYMNSSAGTKRIIYAHEDTILVTVHSNIDNETDLSKLESKIIAQNYLELDKSNQPKKSIQYLEQKKENMNNVITNCGLTALRNLSELKNTSIKTLIQAGEDNGLKLYPYKVPVSKLSSIPMPAILHSENHFVYISSKDKIDPKLKYTGNVLLTKKVLYPKIKTAQLKKITGATFVSSGAIIAYVGAAAAISSTAIGSASAKNAALPQCQKDCKTVCKAEHKALFGGRRKCIKGCRAQCAEADSQEPAPPPETGINWWYVGSGILLVAAILLFIFRKRIATK